MPRTLPATAVIGVAVVVAAVSYEHANTLVRVRGGAGPDNPADLARDARTDLCQV